MDTQNTYEIPDEYKDMMNNINTFVDMAKNTNALTCDTECRENKEKKGLYDNFVLQQTNFINAEKQFENAEKDYLIKTKGDEYYTKYKVEEYKTQANDIVKGLDYKIMELYNLVNEKIYNNNLINKSFENTDELRNMYTTKVNNLKTKIENEENTSNIANRKSYYETKKSSFWCSLNYYLKILFWIIFISYLIIVFVYKQYYKKHVQYTLGLVPFLLFLNGHTIYRTLDKII